MDVFQAIAERTSVRKYTGEEIPEEDLDKILKAARDAPSAKNLQPWKFVVVTDRKRLRELVPACKNQGFVEDCGALIVGVIEEEKWSDIDISIALDHLSLAAVEVGLGTCWIGAFESGELRKELNIPDKFEIKICMTVGYPSEEGESPVKKSLDELVVWEEF